MFHVEHIAECEERKARWQADGGSAWRFLALDPEPTPMFHVEQPGVRDVSRETSNHAERSGQKRQRLLFRGMVALYPRSDRVVAGDVSRETSVERPRGKGPQSLQ